MGLSQNPRNFPDIKAVLDEAVARGGLRYTLDTRGKAVMFRLKAYHFRKITQKLAQVGAPAGSTAPTEYDGLHISLDGNTAIIQFIALSGRMTDLDGRPITPLVKKYEPGVEDEFVEIAQQVKENLK